MRECEGLECCTTVAEAAWVSYYSWDSFTFVLCLMRDPKHTCVPRKDHNGCQHV
jgi:hypothetical protein